MKRNHVDEAVRAQRDSLDSAKRVSADIIRSAAVQRKKDMDDKALSALINLQEVWDSAQPGDEIHWVPANPDIVPVAWKPNTGVAGFLRTLNRHAEDCDLLLQFLLRRFWEHWPRKRHPLPGRHTGNVTRVLPMPI